MISVLGWIVAAYLLGALVIAITATDWKRDEIALLAIWLVSLPVAQIANRWRRNRTTCRICRLRWHDRATMIKHVAVTHTPTDEVTKHG